MTVISKLQPDSGFQGLFIHVLACNSQIPYLKANSIFRKSYVHTKFQASVPCSEEEDFDYFSMHILWFKPLATDHILMQPKLSLRETTGHILMQPKLSLRETTGN